jgi:hypothetical protein
MQFRTKDRPPEIEHSTELRPTPPHNRNYSLQMIQRCLLSNYEGGVHE